MINTTTTGQPIPLSGYCIELLKILEDILGFKNNIYVVEDGNYGTFNLSAKTWNGIVQDIISGVRKLPNKYMKPRPVGSA